MRTSRRITWLVFAVCTLLVVDGFGWVTWQLLSLESQERSTRRRADTQEAVRLALWRMDGTLNTLIAAESVRPYFQYRSFYPADRPYSRMWEDVGDSELLAVSPLLAGGDEFIRLHFEGTSDGWLTSPQVPDDAYLDRVDSASVSASSLLESRNDLLELTAIFRGASPVDAEHVFGRGRSDGAARPTDDLLVQRRDELQSLAVRERDRPEEAGLQRDPTPAVDEAVAAAKAGDRSVQEYQARLQATEEARNRGELNEMQQLGVEAEEPAGVTDLGLADAMKLNERLGRQVEPGRSAMSVHTGRLTPKWLRNPRDGAAELIFIRAVRVQDRETLQGFWVDWPALRESLLDSSSDLLPGASLQPILGQEPGLATPVADVASDAGRLLAGVPAILSPGDLAAVAGPGLTPTRTVLLFAWLAVIAAIIAIAYVLRASLLLGERRGRFVSAVTHELRTPLTTFCLYSQMLDDGMVKDEAKRGEYLGVLRSESERLAAIVENVLAYARVGGGEVRSPANGVRVGDVLDAATPSLRASAEQAGMELVVEDGCRDASVAADAGSIERVLGNLVDNACKYAAGAEDRRVLLAVSTRGNHVEFAVRDFGPGVSARERRRIFSPFARARGAEETAASGLGLGLALSRGVARSLGGDLRLRAPKGEGAEFVLHLPRSSSDA